MKYPIIPGSRCEVISVHHPCFNHWLGRKVIVTKVLGTCAMAHDDEPVTYRINRFGRHVVKHDPRCIEVFYSLDSLRLYCPSRISK